MGFLSALGSAFSGSAGPAIGAVGQYFLDKSNRDWQEKMRASAYQTMVKDLNKAGLNPALAFGSGSAGLAQAPQPYGRSDLREAGSRIVEGAQRGLSSAKQGRVLDDQALTAKAVRMRAEFDAETARIEAGAAPDRVASEIYRNEGQGYSAQSSGVLAGAQIKRADAERLGIDVRRMLDEADLPAARAKGRFDSTEFGEVLREVRRGLEIIPSLRGSGSAARR